MKRISIVSVLFLFIVSIPSTAREVFYTSLRNRTGWSPYKQGLTSGYMEYSPYALSSDSDGLVHRRDEYSPYALSFNSNGIVNHRLEYLPYAYSYYSSGLVDYYVTYSPYALSYDNPGLVCESDWGSCKSYSSRSKTNVIIQNSSVCGVCLNNSAGNFEAYAQKAREEKKAERKTILEEKRINLAEIKLKKQNDPAEIIHQFLKSKNINYKTNQNFRIEGKTISMDFILVDSNIVIKFWNVTEIAEIQKNDGYLKKRYDKYFESWKEYCVNYIGQDIKVCHIFPVDNEDLLTQLALYEEDNFDSDNTLYAFTQQISSTFENN